MAGQPGFFDVDERLKELSAKGDALERLSAVVDFDLFRTDLERAVVRSDRSRGGRPPFDHVLMPDFNSVSEKAASIQWVRSAILAVGTTVGSAG